MSRGNESVMRKAQEFLPGLVLPEVVRVNLHVACEMALAVGRERMRHSKFDAAGGNPQTGSREVVRSSLSLV